jgi:metal-responsive CopG/Arc/MetJ family transcriptional regulator
LIEDMDKLTHAEMCTSRSEYIRKLIRREKLKLKNQEEMVTNHWSNAWGQK